MYINIYNDKGYELFTLPVSSLQIIISKIMIVLIWVFMLLTTFIVLTMFYQSFLDEVIMLENIKNRLHQLFSPNSALLHAAAYVNQLLYLIGAAAAILFAGALANSKYVQKGRGVVAFIVVMIIALTVQTIELNVYNYAIQSFDKNTYGMLYPNFIWNFSYLLSPLYLNSLLIFRTACIALLIFATKYIWTINYNFNELDKIVSSFTIKYNFNSLKVNDREEHMFYYIFGIVLLSAEDSFFGTFLFVHIIMKLCVLKDCQY